MPPTAEEQVAFLTKIQRVLAEGQFTATYKYALLLALADLAVEIGDDSGLPLVVPTKLIAEKFIQYYWRHVVPYFPAIKEDTGLILRQNTDRQAAVVNDVREARHRYGDSLALFKRDKKAWKPLVRRVEGAFWSQPLWRLQRIGAQSLDWLYANRDIGTRVESIELLPGIAWCLRQFHALITGLVRGAWAQYSARSIGRRWGAPPTSPSSCLAQSGRPSPFCGPSWPTCRSDAASTAKFRCNAWAATSIISFPGAVTRWTSGKTLSWRTTRATAPRA